MGAELSYLRPIECAPNGRAVSLRYHAPEFREVCELALTVLSGADPLFNGEVSSAEAAGDTLFSVDLGMTDQTSAEATQDQHVRSTCAMPLHGIIKARSDSLNVQIVSVEPPQLPDAHIEAANTNTHIADSDFMRMLRQAVEAGFCQGRRRVCFIEAAKADASSPSWVNFASRRLTEMFPELEIASMTPADAAAAMASDQFRHDIVIAEPASAEILRMLAVTLTGTEGFAVTSAFTPEGLNVTPLASSGERRADAGSAPILQGLAAGIEALVALKRYAAAGTVHNAILRTLEDGVHPSSVRHIAPYSTKVSDAEFADAVIERFGDRRRNHEPVDYAGYRQGKEGGAGTRSPLRLVHSRDTP